MPLEDLDGANVWLLSAIANATGALPRPHVIWQGGRQALLPPLADPPAPAASPAGLTVAADLTVLPQNIAQDGDAARAADYVLNTLGVDCLLNRLSAESYHLFPARTPRP